MPKQKAHQSQFQPEADTLVLEDQSLQYGFIHLPKQILFARNLSRDAKLLYAVLLGYAWQKGRCFPGYRRLCADMQASENMVRKYMRELESVKLLSQKRRGLGKTNIYTLRDLRTSKIEVQEPQEIAAPEPAKSEGKVEEEEIETERINTSKFRKASTEDQSNGGSTPRQTPIPATSARKTPAAAQGFESVGTTLGRRSSHGDEYDDDRQQILSYLEDFAREFNDQAPLKSTVTRAYRLYKRSGKPIAAFVDAMYQARAITKERSASIRSATEEGRGQVPKKRMPYFLSVLEDVLGLKGDTDYGTYPIGSNSES